jgi:hypothetical protein
LKHDGGNRFHIKSAYLAQARRDSEPSVTARMGKKGILGDFSWQTLAAEIPPDGRVIAKNLGLF